MPMYVFEAKDGRQVERFFHMSDAPEFGAALVEDGVVYTRIPVRPYATVKDAGFTCYTASKYDLERLGHKTFNEHGEGVFTSRKQMDEILAKSQDSSTPLVNVR